MVINGIINQKLAWAENSVKKSSCTHLFIIFLSDHEFMILVWSWYDYKIVHSDWYDSSYVSFIESSRDDLELECADSVGAVLKAEHVALLIPPNTTQRTECLSWSCGAEYLGMKIADMNSDSDAMARLAEVRESLYRLITFWLWRSCGSHWVVVSPATVYKLSQTYHKSGLSYTFSPWVGVTSSFSRLCCCYLRPLLCSPRFHANNAGGPNVDRGVRSARINPYAFETRNRFTQPISFTLLFGRKVLLLYCFIQLFTA